MSFRSLIAVAIIGTAATTCSHGQEASGASILARSPFLPPNFTPPGGKGRPEAATAAPSAYEFRGVYQIGGEYRFLVSEPRSRKGSWVKLGETNENYEVRGFDPSSDTLTLFFNNSEKELSLADLAANPTPMPVSGQIKTASQNQQGAAAPVRRTIRPTTRKTPGAEPGTQSGSAPPPAWLEKLRSEAATRRAQAIQSRTGRPGGVNATGSTGSNSPTGDPGFSPPPPPTSPPPTPPPNLSEIDIPPPPTELPPPPPPEVLERIQQSITSGPPRG